MTMDSSFRVRPTHNGDRRHPGQAWGSDRKRGLVPSRERPRPPRTRGRSGQGMQAELDRLEVPEWARP